MPVTTGTDPAGCRGTGGGAGTDGPSIAGGLAFDRYGGTEMDAVAEAVRKSRNLYI